MIDFSTWISKDGKITGLTYILGFSFGLILFRFSLHFLETDRWLDIEWLMWMPWFWSFHLSNRQVFGSVWRFRYYFFWKIIFEWITYVFALNRTQINISVFQIRTKSTVDWTDTPNVGNEMNKTNENSTDTGRGCAGGL